jgi:hypothetical protein
VTESAELTHEVLLRVAEFLRKLPTDQLEDLASGSAMLEVVAKLPPPQPRRRSDPSAPGGALPVRTAAPKVPLPVRTATPKVPLPRPVEEIGAELSNLTDRSTAAAYLDDLKLTVAQLRSLAAGLGIAVSSKATKAQARDTIVQWTVGRRADAAILSRPASRRVF